MLDGALSIEYLFITLQNATFLVGLKILLTVLDNLVLVFSSHRCQPKTIHF